MPFRTVPIDNHAIIVECADDAHVVDTHDLAGAKDVVDNSIALVCELCAVAVHGGSVV